MAMTALLGVCILTPRHREKTLIVVVVHRDRRVRDQLLLLGSSMALSMHSRVIR